MRTRYRHCKECNKLHDVDAWPHQAEPEQEAAAYIPGKNYDDYLMGPKSGTFRKCKACGDFHDIYNWPANHWEEPPPRSELASPAFISDNLESIGGLRGLQCQVSGKWFTSKKKMRDEYRARGVIELGNDKPAPIKKPKPDRRKIKEAVQRAMSAVDNEGATAANYRARNKTKTVFGTVVAK